MKEQEIKCEGKKLKVICLIEGDKSHTEFKVYGYINGIEYQKNIAVGDREEWLQEYNGISFINEKRIEIITICTEFDEKIKFIQVCGKGTFEILTYKFI